MTSRAAGTRYARAMFDVALKESDIREVGREDPRKVVGHRLESTMCLVLSHGCSISHGGPARGVGPG